MAESVLAVSAADRICVIPIAHVVETMRPLPIAPVLGVPAAVLGLAVIRGEPTPVVDLAALLAPGATRGVGNRMVTLALDGRCVALAVERVIGVRTLDTTHFCELPPLLRGADNVAVESIGSADQQLMVVLQAARLVPDAVWTSLQNAGRA